MIPVRAAPLVRFVMALAMLCAWAALSAAADEAATAAGARGANPAGEQLGVSHAPVAAPPPADGPIALVLPLDSADYGRAADAVRAGFLAAARAASGKALVIAHGDGGVQEAFAKARAAGARVIVGPLLRDDVKWLASTTDPLPWTIVLNQADDASPLPEHVIALALSTESDAMQVARRMAADGAQSVAIVAGDTPLSRRFVSGFNAEWILRGGAAPLELRFERAPELLVALRAELNRARVDAVALALDAADAAVVKPYLGQLPVYAGSQVNDRIAPAAMRDLDDVRFVEVPWIADPEAATFGGIARGDYASPFLQRLYALGIDAFRVARAFAAGPPSHLEFDGATGHLTLDGRRFDRDGTLMQFRSGQAVPVAGR